MPSQHKHSPLRFRPPEVVREWLEKRAAATGEPMNAILTAAVRLLMRAESDPALAAYRSDHEKEDGQ